MISRKLDKTRYRVAKNLDHYKEDIRDFPVMVKTRPWSIPFDNEYNDTINTHITNTTTNQTSFKTFYRANNLRGNLYMETRPRQPLDKIRPFQVLKTD